MTYIVYADIMLGCNILINFIVILIASLLLHVGIRLSRALLWSVLTGCITEAEYLIMLRQNTLIHHILYVGIYIIMTNIYFRGRKYRDIFVNSLCVLISMMLLYGALTCVHAASGLRFTRLIPTGFVCFLFIAITGVILQSNCHEKENSQNVILTLGDRTISVNGYVDTGNLLRDHYTGNPVIILDYRVMRSLLGAADYRFIEQYHDTGEFDYLGFGNGSATKMYPLPYRTVDSDFSVMPAFQITELTLTDIGKTVSHVTAGISRYRLMQKGNYRILLNESLIS